MSERMLCVAEIDWFQAVASAERPVEFLLSKGIAVYIKVRGDSEIVYRYYKAPIRKGEQSSSVPHSAFLREEAVLLEGEALADFARSQACDEEATDSLPYAGFVEGATFLRLGDVALAEIAASRSCHVSSFSGAGFLIPRPYEVTGQTHGGYSIKKPLRIESSDLTRFEFDHAILVDKKRRDWLLARVSPMNAPSPEQFAMQIEVGESDLYVNSTDFEALKQEVQREAELVLYPFSHRERMPGIYWMFQAAYAHNQLKLMPRDEVKNWLNDKAPAQIYRHRSIRTAVKFVWPELDRATGGKGRGKFILSDLDCWTNRSDYEFPYVSKGLSFILAVADWWVDVLERSPGETNVTLAKKLKENKFGGLEVGDLVYLISGSRLTGSTPKD